MKKYKFGASQFKKSTPSKIKNISTGILAICTILSGASIINDYPMLALSILIIGAISKTVAQFFSDEPDQPETEKYKASNAFKKN